MTINPAVIPSLLSGQALSAAKDLRSARRKILLCAQDDRNVLVRAYGGGYPRWDFDDILCAIFTCTRVYSVLHDIWR